MIIFKGNPPPPPPPPFPLPSLASCLPLHLHPRFVCRDVLQVGERCHRSSLRPRNWAIQVTCDVWRVACGV
jgi:hypothetical protein